MNRPGVLQIPRSGAARHHGWSTALADVDMPMSVGSLTTAEPRAAESVRRQRIDDIDLLGLSCGAMSVARTASTIRSTRERQWVVMAIEAGQEFVEFGGRRVRLGAGDVIAWHSEQRLRFGVADSVRKWSMLIPECALGARFRDGAGSRVHVVPASGSTALVSSCVRALAEGAAELSSTMQESAARAAIEMIVGLIEDRLVRTAPEVALRASVDGWIDAHLTDPALGPEAVADAHAVSVRTVYRLFSGDGHTLGREILRKRLDRVRAELRRGDLPVGELAAKWCFADSSHLARAFKAQYGLSPSAYRVDHSDRSVR